MVAEENTEKVWTRDRLISIGASLIVIVALGFASYRVGERAATPSPVATKPASNPAAVNPAPAAPSALAAVPAQISAASLKSAAGPAFKLADFAGKVTLINLWATWCGPCRKETPELVKIYQDFKNRGVEMIGLSTEDPTASAENVHKFVQDYNVDYRIGWIPDEYSSVLMQGHNSIPQSFIVGRDGRIRNHFVGFSAATTATQLRQALEDALKDKS